ncbi:MAG: hypothetical protein KY458_03615 [Actinobacteria bacterium]|nr:hypothetical protein [Actinomycetota bacterium]
MLGAGLVAVVILFVLPPLFLMTGAVVSAVMGWALRARAEEDHVGSELIDLNY